MAHRDCDHYGPFEGVDGRTTVSPPKRYTLHAKAPKAVRVANARKLIDDLCRYGMVTHSEAGTMLWVGLWWCDYHKKTFVLKCHGDGGATLCLDEIPPGVHI